MPVSAQLEAILRRERDRFNQTFLLARTRFPRLDGAATLALFRDLAAALLTGAERRACADPAPALLALFETTVTLAGRELAGVGGRLPEYARCLGACLASAPRALLEAPRELIPGLANALYNLLSRSARAGADWSRTYVELADLNLNRETLELAGGLAAWRAGLAHYRAAALARAADLPPAALFAALRATEAQRTQLAPRLQEFVSRLIANPWTTPENWLEPEREELVARPGGGFRGFGGVFASPPEILVGVDGWLASDADSAYRIFVDAYGWSIRAIGETEAIGAYLAQPASAAAPIPVKSSGEFYLDNRRYVFAELAGFQGVAASGATVLFAHPGSFQIYALGRPRL